MPVSFRVRSWLIPLLLALLVAGLSVLIIQDFGHPLSDGDDTDQYEYAGYYLFKNLTLWPWPHLNLVNNQTFYPYGTNQVFLPWGFERDYWYALGYWLNGNWPGPFLQYYYVYSLVVGAVGTYLLLRGLFGEGRAFWAGLVVSIVNFYTLYKYPVHLNMSVIHWTTLCIVATYRLLYSVYHNRPVSLRYWLLLVWLHLNVLGLELGYVAGYALAFTTLTAPVLLWLFYQRFPTLSQWPARVGQFIAGSRIGWGLPGLIVLSFWLYFPLTLQISINALGFNFGVVPELPAWSHPLRLLIPTLPGLDNYAIPYQRYFHDVYESYAQGSPGLYLTLLAGTGLWAIRQRVLLWLPLVAMLVLCLLYHPVLLPTLKIFPWFSFNRYGGRASMVYPVLLMLLAVQVPFPTARWSWLLAGVGLLLMLAEWTHGFRSLTFVHPTRLAVSVEPYMRTIRHTPGIAILDWPFCTIGANGVGEAEGLCPFYHRQNAVFTFRRFHDKAVVGQYFGRLHPDQIRPLLRDGWPLRLRPDHDFTPADWQFLDQYLRTNQFAGINLYPDLLTPAQRQAFYVHYGPPVVETVLPRAGRVQFLRMTYKKTN